MADEEQPAWLRDSTSGGGGNGAASSSSPAAESAATSTGKEPRFKGVVKTLVLIMNLGCSFFMAATGALGVGSADSVNDTGTIFVGIYMVLFAAIGFTHEVAQFCPNTSIDNIIKRNFGFLYGHIGKGLYILFMGILAFGLSGPKALAMACGIIVSAWGPSLILLYLWLPAYFDKKEKYQP